MAVRIRADYTDGDEEINAQGVIITRTTDFSLLLLTTYFRNEETTCPLNKPQIGALVAQLRSFLETMTDPEPGGVPNEHELIY